jgi:methionyl-tRNA formyltransferase
VNIYILTQEDSFYLPKFFDNFFAQKSVNYNVVGVSILKGEIDNKNIFKYLKLLRFLGSIKVFFKYLANKVLDLVSKIFNLNNSFSVYSSFNNRNVPVRLNHDINTDEFVNYLNNLKVDLVVSVACPKIIKTKLINNFDNKIINIHGSLLPKYRGMLPSFWVLLNGEKETGVTVHYINDKIDDGDIIGQLRIPCKKINSMHELLLVSKIKYGPSLLLEVMKKIYNKEELTRIKNISNGSYFSFPDYISIKRFYERGNKVI